MDGNVETMFYVKNIEVNVEKNKEEIPVLGYVGVKHKAAGWKGSGSMTLYYLTSKFRKMMIDYMKTGVDTYFDLLIENEDKSSSTGKQTLKLTGVNIDSIILSKLDIESAVLDEDVDFTFNAADYINTFNDVELE